MVRRRWSAAVVDPGVVPPEHSVPEHQFRRISRSASAPVHRPRRIGPQCRCGALRLVIRPVPLRRLVDADTERRRL